MNSMLSDAIRRGTGTKAMRSLKRGDLRGKTGTTNDADIWFSGFTPDLVATTWAGFSDNSPVGSREWGSTTPIETWIEFMAKALPEESESRVLPRPDGVVSVKIDPETGLRTDPTDPDTDGDGVCDGDTLVAPCTLAGPDNCPFIANFLQVNSDIAPAGDECPVSYTHLRAHET